MTAPLHLDGQRFGRLTVLHIDGQHVTGANKRRRWLCRCDCGQTTHATTMALRRSVKRSCGCLNRDSPLKIKHGHARVGKHTREHRIWCGILRRCTNPNDPGYARYGARGIGVCDRWRHSFEAWLADMGPCPSPVHSIDRINNDLGYSPDNCRWATPAQQARNKSTTIGLVARSLIRHLRRRGVGVMALSHAFGTGPKTINHHIKGIGMGLNTNEKIEALLAGHVSIDNAWTRDDFAALAVAAADQAGCSVREQMRIAAIVSVPETTPETAADRHVNNGAR